MTDLQQPRTHERYPVLMKVSNEMVRIYKEQFGRGPTHARSDWAGRDVLVATLENSETAAERNLVAMGEHQRLRDTRMFFQYACEPDFREAVERTTGRKVRAFVSGMDVVHDVATEVFYLEPAVADAGDSSNGAAAHPPR